MNFELTQLPSRVSFGAGRLATVREEAGRLGAQRALVLATKYQIDLAQHVAGLLGDLCVGVHAEAVQHVPYETVAAAIKKVDELQIDLLIAPGGGSTIGLAKGIVLERPLPILAIPTTYAGSEMTHIWGISKDGKKTTGRDPIVKPATVIYDPDLIRSLPAAMSITSGINAMAHAVEALYAENRNPISSMMAEESIRSLAAGLPLVAQNLSDLKARTDTMYGAWLAAVVLDQVGMALHHKLCHTLGGSFGMPHAEVHTVVLPYAIAYNQSHAPEMVAALSRALGCDPADIAGTVQDISRQNGGPVSLKELNFKEENLEEAAQIATQNPYYNPRPVDLAGIRQLLSATYLGVRP
ncbi:MAG: maleylacetate reductase [Anaerolineae bacterium]